MACLRPLISATVSPLIVIAVGTAVMGQHARDHTAELGEVSFSISCNDGAQQAFNRGVSLLHHMTYPQAERAFESVTVLDPNCAMAHWGIAMTLFQPLWPTRPGPRERRRGWEAVRAAQSLAPPTEREQLFVGAAEAFFLDPESEDYWTRIRRWADATKQAYDRYPEDVESAAFYALALLATAPPGSTSLDHHNRAAEILDGIHSKNARHPGSLHYLIHANDVSGRQNESLDLVRGYGDIAPRNPHALHMPTHVYTRLGLWEEVVDGNLAAAEAALEYPAGAEGEYVWDEFPHAIEYLVYAYLQQGDDTKAALQMERLLSTDSLQPSFKTAFHLSSVPARYALERRSWEEAARLNPHPDPGLDWEKFPWPEAVTWFARGLGSSHLNRLDEARVAEKRLMQLEDAAASAGEELFTRQIRVLRFAVSSRIAQVQGDGFTARKYLKDAGDLESSTPKHPVTPAPTIPAYELLGDLMLEQGDPEGALAAYESTLSTNPGRLNSLAGALHASRLLDDRTSMATYCNTLGRLISRDSHRADIQEACDPVRSVEH